MRIKKPTLGNTMVFFLLICIFCFDGDANLVRVLYAAVALFIVYMMKRLLRGLVPAYHFQLWIPFVVVCGLSIIWSANRYASLTRTITLALNVVVFGLLWIYIYENHKQLLLLKAIAIAGGVFAIYIVSYYGGIQAFIRLMSEADERSRIGGEVAHLSLIGQSLSLAGIVDIWVYFHVSKEKKGWYLLILIIETLVVIASQSRTGLAFLAVGCGIILLQQSKSEKMQKWIFRMGLIATIAIIVLINIDLSSIMARWTGLFSSTHDASTLIRFRLIEEGLTKFLDRPLVGYGIDASGTVSVYHSYFHNNYVELLATTGLLGTIAYYGVYVGLWLRLRKMNPKNDMVMLAKVLLLIQLCMMLATVTYYVKYQQVMLVFIEAVAYQKSKIRQKL